MDLVFIRKKESTAFKKKILGQTLIRDYRIMLYFRYDKKSRIVWLNLILFFISLSFFCLSWRVIVLKAYSGIRSLFIH